MSESERGRNLISFIYGEISTRTHTHTRASARLHIQEQHRLEAREAVRDNFSF